MKKVEAPASLQSNRNPKIHTAIARISHEEARARVEAAQGYLERGNELIRQNMDHFASGSQSILL